MSRLSIAVVMTLLGAIAVMPCPLPAQDQTTTARRILDGPEYRGYRVEPAEYDHRGGDNRGNAGSTDSTRREAGAAPPPRPTRSQSRSSRSLSPPAWIGDVFQVIVWGLLIVAAVVALYFIVRALIGIRLGKRRAKPVKKRASAAKAAEEKVSADAPDDAPHPAPLFEDALAAAQREYEQAVRDGDWARATLLGYRIFWLRAGWQGCVQESDVRTWRDALAMVRVSELRRRLRDLLRMIEAVRYGRHVPGQDEFTAWKQQLDLLEPQEVLR